MTGPTALTTGESWTARVAGDIGDAALRGPIIVLTYAHAGDKLLTNALSASRTLACTHGTGLLPLCHSAASTWQSVENRGSAPSSLAVSSIRALVNTMAAVLHSGAGATRWCETAYVSAAAAETFLRLFPEAAFLCLHRSLKPVLADGIRAYPWGLGSSPFWSHAVGHPGNNVATIAEYWAAHTEQLLDFEDRHPRCALRVKYEDLADHPDRIVDAVYEFLGLDVSAPSALRAVRRAPDEKGEDAEPAVQLAQLPDQLRSKIGDLHARLGYDCPAFS
jgi:hypothetical protein